MASFVDTDDHQWRPSLAPIRTTASSPCTHASNKETYYTPGESHGSHNVKHPPDAVSSTSSTPAATPFSPTTGCPDSSMPSDSPPCHSNKLQSCVPLLTSCFPCARPHPTSTSHDRPHRCTSTCMHRKRFHALRSLAFLFPASGRVQFFYTSTPTAKAQLSGTLPRMPSTKIEQYMSPSATTLTSQSSGKFSHLPSPRTPFSNKVQHFSGAIPSPRALYSPSVAISPASARRKKPSFSLLMPPGVMDKNKACEQISDEPSSPHVTCIGKVIQQTHCKKLLRSDTIDPCTHHHQSKASQKKCTAMLRIEHQSFPDPPPTNTSYSTHQCNVQNECLVAEHATMVGVCPQRLDKEKMLDLHKIQGRGQGTGDAYASVAYECDDRAQGQEDTASSDEDDGVQVVCHGSHDKEPLHEIKSGNQQVHGKSQTSNDTECIPSVRSPSECRSSVREGEPGAADSVKLHG